jgi:hypothetical protein
MHETVDELNKVCEEVGICIPQPSDHELLLHFGQTELGSPGQVVNPTRAKDSTCTCFKYKAKEICWQRGVIGTLTQEQKATFCTNKVYVDEPKLLERYTSFADAAEAAHRKVAMIPRGERLQPWLNAMSEELSRRGIEV